MSEAKKRGIARQAFRDAGTGQNFEAREAYDFEPGAYANYLAAGLVEAAPAPTAPEKADHVSAPSATKGKAAA